MRLLNLVKISLMAAVLSSCKVSDFPEVHPHRINLKNGACGEYKEVSRKPLKYQFVQWLPIESCENFFAISPDETAALREYYDNHRD